MAKIVAVKVPKKLEEDKFEQLASYISIERREQLGRFIRKEDAYRSLFGELLARSVIMDEMKMLNQHISFRKNLYGKPMLSGNKAFQFNISHSGRWVVMIHGEKTVGIDIEQTQAIDLGVANCFFSPLEIADLKSKAEADRREYFYDLWTLKESYIKAQGTGLSMPLDSFSIRINGKEIMMEPDHPSYQFRQYEIDREYKLSACSIGGRLPESIKISKEQDLIRSLMRKQGG